jgi:hypothetical protein
VRVRAVVRACGRVPLLYSIFFIFIFTFFFFIFF